MGSILITGGARSGKSLRAEVLTRGFPGRPVYIATAEPRDGEMAERVAIHRARRAAEIDRPWIERAAPIELANALRDTDGGGARLVDCLTLWLTNLMLADRDWRGAAEVLVETLTAQVSPVVMVTNEVGLGIVPQNALARAFRDAQGSLNQMIAARAETVEFVVAGCPMRVKG